MLPADMRAHFIGAVAHMVADDVAAQSLPPIVADRIRAMLTSIIDAAEELREQLSPGMKGAEPKSTAPEKRNAPALNVIDLRTWRRG